jgi:uncharacterized protein YgiM (DUF1202 family)
MVAETQIERLSSIIDARNGRSTSESYKPSAKREYSRAPSLVEVSAPQGAPLNVARSVQAEAELPIATVVTDKVSLRTGPDKRSQSLTALTKGTQLPVETRQGEWYRVITPTGSRGWVAAAGIAFGDHGTVPAVGSTKRNPAPRVDVDAEEKAFELIKQRAQ